MFSKNPLRVDGRFKTVETATSVLDRSAIVSFPTDVGVVHPPTIQLVGFLKFLFHSS
jgi:hypothetical protein